MTGVTWLTVDDVDLMVFAGHGFYAGYHGVPYNSLHYYTLNSSTSFHPNSEAGHADNQANANSDEIWWGYNYNGVTSKTKWVVTYSCNMLWSGGSGWAGIMQGVHMVCGFASVMYIVADEGTVFGQKLYQGNTVMSSFFDAAFLYQPLNSTPTTVRVLTADISQNDKINSYSVKPLPIGGIDTYSYWDMVVQPR